MKILCGECKRLISEYIQPRGKEFILIRLKDSDIYSVYPKDLPARYFIGGYGVEIIKVREVLE